MYTTVYCTFAYLHALTRVSAQWERGLKQFVVDVGFLIRS